MRQRVTEVTIANAASLSGAAILDGDIVAIVMPSAWTAANLTFQGATIVQTTGATPGGVTVGTYQDIYDSGGTELAVTAAASRYIVLTPALAAALRGFGAIKIRSGTSGTPVNQGAARTISIVTWQYK